MACRTVDPPHRTSLNLTKLRAEGTGDEVVGPASLHLSVGADGGHGESGDNGDDGGEEDDDDSQADPGLTHHPAQSDEQHHPPDVQETADLQ